jgi:hypothetical protein
MFSGITQKFKDFVSGEKPKEVCTVHALVALLHCGTEQSRKKQHKANKQSLTRKRK